jgi:3-oxoacyl-[acyl-carrier protein] reductase
MRLENKVALITGAAQGIGEAYAHRFAKEGATVVVADLNVEKGQAVAEAIGKAASFERLDVASEDDTKRVADAVAARLGRIDVLINNAAMFYGLDHRNYSYEYLRKVFDVNYFCAWLMSRAVFPHMRKAGGGSVINQSSAAAYMHPETPLENPDADPLPSFHYSVTKAAINAMTHYMAGNVGRFGIRVNAIAPGPTMTDATKQGVPEDIIGMIVQFQMAIHRPLQPDDVTGTAVWLASDDSAMVTGQVIPVDGGMIMLG